MNKARTAEQYTWLLTKEYQAVSFKYISPYVKDKRVLDLGCGTGVYLEKFSRASVGVDASIPNLQKLRQKGLSGLRTDLNGNLPFKSESFDVIFCSHILEHVDVPIKLLRESHRVLKRKGFIIIALPIEKSFARLVLRDHYFRDHPTHLYSFSLDCLRHLLEKSGFSQYHKTFVDIPGVRRFHLIWLMDFFQILPFGFSRLVASNFWVIGKKDNGK